jgi:hypothetical protein
MFVRRLFKNSITIYLIYESSDIWQAGYLSSPLLTHFKNLKFTTSKGERKNKEVNN